MGFCYHVEGQRKNTKPDRERPKSEVKMKIGDLVTNFVGQTGIVTVLSDCGTMAWVAWMHIGMKETRIPARLLEVINGNR